MPSNYLRVLQCMTCKSMEEVPDFEGPPEYDVVLHEVDYKHGGAEDDAVRIHERALHRVEKKYWDNPKLRRQIVEQMWAGVTGFKPEYYDARNQLLEDAGKCFRDHHMPEECGDWHSGPKLLGNPAARERRELARDLRNDDLRETRVKVFLCDFCPVASKVMERRRLAAGAYDL